MVSSNGAARSSRLSVENAPVAAVHCAPRSCSTYLRGRACVHPYRHCDACLRTQLPITTREERLRLAFLRRHNNCCPTAAAWSTTGGMSTRSTAAASTSLQERNRSSFVGCARSLASRCACCCLMRQYLRHERSPTRAAEECLPPLARTTTTFIVAPRRIVEYQQHCTFVHSAKVARVPNDAAHGASSAQSVRGSSWAACGEL
jgi:hypothetical protein